jgi:glycosyltransferase involved in cell wall biosynthesis
MHDNPLRCVVFVIPLGGSGPHTGHQTLYRDLVRYTDVLEIRPKRNLFSRMVGKGIGLLRHYGHRDQSCSYAELFFDAARRKPNAIGHLSSVEAHFPYLRSKSKRQSRLCGTIHFPLHMTPEANRVSLQRLGAAVCFWTRDFERFEKYVGKGRLHFIHHGVDTGFFCAEQNSQRSVSPRVLVAGQFLRNFAMLQRVVSRLVQCHPTLEFDFLIPEWARDRETLPKLRQFPQIHWHAGLSEAQLRDRYRQSYIHLLPMSDSGANNAIVESLACGLPVITTDVGGIRDYGGGTTYPVVANNDDDAMIGLVEQYLAQPAWRDEISQNCRRFAEETLAWPLIAKRHWEIFKELSA